MFILFLNHLLALIGFRVGRSTVRPLLPVLNGFSLLSKQNIDEFIDTPFQSYVQNLRAALRIVGDIEILQTNNSRAKVVFKAYDHEGEQIVVKWINSSALFTFQCFGFPQVDKYIHGEISAYTCGFIPKLRFSTHDSIAIDYVSGVPLDIYLDACTDLSPLKHILQSIFIGMRAFYSRTLSTEPLDISLFNTFLIRDYTYMRQISSSIRLGDLVRFLSLSSDLEELYVRQTIRASRIFCNRSTPWLKTMCLRDLGLQNIMYREDLKKAFCIDVEDAYEGHFVFDLAWLSSSIYLTLEPLEAFDFCNGLFKSFILSVDDVDPDSSLSLYYRLLTSYLIMSVLNPTHRTASQSRTGSFRLLRLIDTIASL